MIKALSCKVIREDFAEKMILTDDEIEVLEMLLKGYMITKIALLTHQSDRNVGKIIRRLKDKFENYRKLELSKMCILSS